VLLALRSLISAAPAPLNAAMLAPSTAVNSLGISKDATKEELDSHGAKAEASTGDVYCKIVEVLNSASGTPILATRC